VILANVDLAIAKDNIAFPIEVLTTNRHYNVTVKSTNAAGSDTSYFPWSE
jgi:hypothetical protein